MGYYWDEEIGTHYVRARNYLATMARWLSQDPLFWPLITNFFGGIDGDYSHLNLMRYVNNCPSNIIDASGLQACNCGPDITTVFARFLAAIAPTLRNTPSDQRGPVDGTIWLWNNAINIDFYSTFESPQCPTSPCEGSVTLCGNCVRNTTPNNILFGLVAEAHGVPRTIQTLGANFINLATHDLTLEGDEQQHAYYAGQNIYESLLRHPNFVHSRNNICSFIDVPTHRRRSAPFDGIPTGYFQALRTCRSCGFNLNFGQVAKIGIGNYGSNPIPDEIRQEWLDDRLNP